MNKRYRDLVSSLAVLFLIAGDAAANKVNLQFRGMAIHAGQMLWIRAWDKASGEEVGRESLAVPGDAFEVPLWVMRTGRSYWIDFYADHNGNGRYDAPPADHAYRLGVDNASSDVDLAFTHTANFTDIAWPEAPAWGDYFGTWQGTWENQTYGTFAPITVVAVLSPDGSTLRTALSTSGLFGNPQPFTASRESAFSADAESLTVASQTVNWTGFYVVRKGNLRATLVAAPLGVVLTLLGHFGPTRAVVSYTMAGAFTARGVVLMNKISSTGAEEGKGPVAAGGYELAQNFPNPFNPSTEIAFSLDRAEDVRLGVYDLAGRPVAGLVAGRRDAGAHRVRFDASALPSGAYFYRLEAGGRTLTGKMIKLE